MRQRTHDTSTRKIRTVRIFVQTINHRLNATCHAGLSIFRINASKTWSNVSRATLCFAKKLKRTNGFTIRCKTMCALFWEKKNARASPLKYETQKTRSLCRSNDMLESSRTGLFLEPASTPLLEAAVGWVYPEESPRDTRSTCCSCGVGVSHLCTCRRKSTRRRHTSS